MYKLSKEPTFRILAPKYICGSPPPEAIANTTIYSVPSNHQITIGLQTRSGQRLRYHVTIYFTLLNGFISQRHTLHLWRSVRQLERQLNKNHEQISVTNQIVIPNKDLVPRTNYTFSITGVDEADVVSQAQNFTITYRGKNTGTSVVQDRSSASNDVSLILLGSEVAYPDLPYLVTAKIIFCEARNDYKLNWTISESNNAIQRTLSQSNELEIPAGVFLPNADVKITAIVLNSTDGTLIAKAEMKVTILNRARRVVLYPTKSTAGFSQSTLIDAVSNADEETYIVWSCEDATGDTSCSDDLIVKANSVSISFLKEPSYEITASVGNISTTSNIEVSTKSTISVVLQKLPPMFLIPGRQYEFVADVSGLVPKCICNWTVVNETGYATFPSAVVETLGGIFINDVDENFLSELVDYGNDTVEREVKLTIPAMSLLSNQTLLESDVSYKLRLETSCPEPINDNFNASTKRDTVNTYWDMILETNGPPEGMPLEITPLELENGIALETLFTWSVEVAKDTETDYPLMYSYWYETAGNSIKIASYYEVMSAETQLPFSHEKISTYYVVCDSRAACTRVSGPSVTVQFNSVLDLHKLQFMVDSIQSNFNRINLREACKIAFETLLTLKNQNSESFDIVYQNIITIIENEIPKIQTAFLDQSPPLTEESILQLAQQVKVLLDFERGSNDHILGQLLELIDHVEEKTVRKARSPSPKPITNTVDTSSTKIELYESLINSPNGTALSKNTAKAQLLSYIPEVAQRLCGNQQVGYSDDWFTLETMRLKPATKNSLRGSIRIPSDVKLPQRATISVTEFPSFDVPGESVSYLCLGTVAFHRDLLSDVDPAPEQTQFHLFLTAVDKNELGVLAEWTKGLYLWNLTIMATDTTKRYKCQLWFENWTDKFCESSLNQNFLVCNCTRVSYLRVILEPGSISINVIASTTPTTTVGFTEITTDTDMLTFAPLSTLPAEEETLPRTTVSTTGTNQTSELAMPPSQPAVFATNSTVDESTYLEPNKTGHSFLKSAAGPLGYTIVGALALCALLTLAAMILYKRRRRTTTLAEELQGMAVRMRSQSLPVRYARFQDEHNMSGDNVSTISDTITI
ncbi:uncharacterized protein LOC128745541 [Sabethes cyaneus]|uniref:uncharacterized protein LOC128745541 n=1 Tax=Sabethes cyaneus TaxID=53552 RepID=UPI00237D7D75|nr:uncharacterized protein LOC128745541 [Sabethes cyaneus]